MEFILLLFLLVLSLFSWPFLLLPKALQSRFELHGNLFAIFAPEVLLYSLIVNVLLAVGLRLLWYRFVFKDRDTRTLVLAILFLAIPGAELLPPIAKLFVYDPREMDAGPGILLGERQLRFVGLRQPSPSNSADSSRFNGQWNSVKIVSGAHERLLFMLPDAAGELVGYEPEQNIVDWNVSKADWVAARCMQAGVTLHEPALILAQPADNEDLFFQGKPFRKSSSIWTGYLLAPNGSYLALFSSGGDQVNTAPVKDAMWNRTNGRFPITVDVYRLPDAKRVVAARYYPTDGARPSWLDNGFLLIPTSHATDEVLLASLPAEPPVTLPFTDDLRMQFEDSLESSCDARTM